MFKVLSHIIFPILTAVFAMMLNLYFHKHHASSKMMTAIEKYSDAVTQSSIDLLQDVITIAITGEDEEEDTSKIAN